VFDGQRGNYFEADTHTEINAYGRSKSFGEINNSKDITFRMSIVGPELKNGTGLLNWVLTNNQDELPGWDNAWWNGITTLQLAKCIDQYINNPVISGVYHLVNNDVRINKYDLLCKINAVYELGKKIVRTQGPKTVNKVLIDTRSKLDFAIPDYNTQLQQLKDFT
jgi:dTDP-4-dehydrorhamnose reductase